MHTTYALIGALLVAAGLPAGHVVPGHLGDLHAYEQALVLAVAFGPFLLLWLVLGVARRRDAREASAPQEAREEPQEESHS